MLTNQRDAFGGHSICYALVCCSNVVPKHAVFQVFNIKDVVTLKSGSEVTHGHWNPHGSIRYL